MQNISNGFFLSFQIKYISPGSEAYFMLWLLRLPWKYPVLLQILNYTSLRMKPM